MREKLYEMLTKVKKVKFSCLVSQHYSLHLDRVSRFLQMLTQEFSVGAANELNEFFLNEVKFARDKINRQELY